MNSKPKYRCRVKVNSIVIGIDVAKYRHVAVALRWDGEYKRSITFCNNLRGFEDLVKYIEKAKREFECDQVIVAIEPTGHYWESLVEWLEKRGVSMVFIQTAHTKRAKEMMDNSPEKTDQKDALVIAELALQGKGLTVVAPRGVFADLRYLSKARQRVVKDRTSKVNVLHKIIDLLFPELITVFKRDINKTLLAFLRVAQTPEEAVALGKGGLAALFKKASRGRLGAERAEAVWEAARESIGVKEGVDVLRFELKQTLDRLDLFQEEIKGLEGRLVVALAGVPYAKNLLGIKGIGKITLATILGEAGDFRRYHCAREIIKLAGLNLYTLSSGEQNGHKHITKRGRSLLRQSLYWAALRLVKQEGVLHDFYQRLLDAKKPKPKALVAVATKILWILFAMVRDNSLFVVRNYNLGRPALGQIA